MSDNMDENELADSEPVWAPYPGPAAQPTVDEGGTGYAVYETPAEPAPAPIPQAVRDEEAYLDAVAGRPGVDEAALEGLREKVAEWYDEMDGHLGIMGKPRP